jgi:hypothetical protein
MILEDRLDGMKKMKKILLGARAKTYWRGAAAPLGSNRRACKSNPDSFPAQANLFFGLGFSPWRLQMAF